MMYYLKKEYEHFTEDHSHDLWVMIRTLQEAPLAHPSSSYSAQRETGDQMLNKYYLTREEKDKEKDGTCNS